jgi:hypothetical protein
MDSVWSPRMATKSPHSSHTATQETNTLVHSKPPDTYQLSDFGKSSKDIPFAARRHNNNRSIVRYEKILCSEYPTIISLPRRLSNLVSSQQYTELWVHYRWHGLTCIAAQTENRTPTKARWPIQQQGGNLKQQQHEKLSLSQSECPAVDTSTTIAEGERFTPNWPMPSISLMHNLHTSRYCQHFHCSSSTVHWL